MEDTMIAFAYYRVREVKETHTSEEANYLLQNGWTLLLVVSGTYVLGRVEIPPELIRDPSRK